jgi:creatinine amidohydrolase
VSIALADLAWPVVATRQAEVLAVPIGSTEQHGPHLPLSTDTDIAVALAHALSRYSSTVVVAPPLAYGASGEHADFPGTLSIGHDSLELLLLELCRSASATFARIVLVSTHGGNSNTVHRAAERLREEGRDVIAWIADFGGDAHAGQVETSLMLAIHGTRVDLRRAEAGNTEPIDDLMPVLRTVGVRSVSPNGVLGDPSGATVEEGHRLLERAVRDLAAAAKVE